MDNKLKQNSVRNMNTVQDPVSECEALLKKSKSAREKERSGP